MSTTYTALFLISRSRMQSKTMYVSVFLVWFCLN